MINTWLNEQRVSIQYFSTADVVAFSTSALLSGLLIPVVVESVVNDGSLTAFAKTFGVSVVVWIAVYEVFRYLRHLNTIDFNVWLLRSLVALAALSLLPFNSLSWVIGTLFAVLMIWADRDLKGGAYNAGWIIFAISIPMFWSKRIFHLFSDFFLSIDAALVSSITMTPRDANLVVMPGDPGRFLEIAAPCSSMANVSLAILCWIVFSRANALKWHVRNLVWVAGACLAVVTINVTRISLIGYFPDQYELLHGQVGSTVVSWLTFVVVVVICIQGVRRLNDRAI